MTPALTPAELAEIEQRAARTDVPALITAVKRARTDRDAFEEKWRQLEENRASCCYEQELRADKAEAAIRQRDETIAKLTAERDRLSSMQNDEMAWRKDAEDERDAAWRALERITNG